MTGRPRPAAIKELGMLKKIIIFILVLAVFTVTATYIFRGEIKRYGLEVLLRSFPIPNVKMAKVDFDETEGTLTLEGVNVKNARGFSYPNILEAEKVVLDIDLVMGAKPRLNIKRIDITRPVLYVERSEKDIWNFRELPKDMPVISFNGESRFSLIEEAYAEEAASPLDKGVVNVPSEIEITDGTVHFTDKKIDPREPYSTTLTSVNGIVKLYRATDGEDYERMTFDGGLILDGVPSQRVNGVLSMDLAAEKPTYNYNATARGIDILYLKPYIEGYSPFLVYEGMCNGNTKMNAVNGATESTYTLELMNLRFAVNPNKANIPFMETSVQKISTYLVTQSGSVVMDFKQRGDAQGNSAWGLGPISKRAISIAAVDTVIDIINKGMGKSGGETPSGEDAGQAGGAAPGRDIQDVIDIFKDIF